MLSFLSCLPACLLSTSSCIKSIFQVKVFKKENVFSFGFDRSSSPCVSEVCRKISRGELDSMQPGAKLFVEKSRKREKSKRRRYAQKAVTCRSTKSRNRRKFQVVNQIVPTRSLISSTSHCVSSLDQSSLARVQAPLHAYVSDRPLPAAA